MLKFGGRAVAALVLASLMAGPALAQTATAAAETEAAEEGTIVVTGTLIRNPNLVSAVPITTTSADTIALRGSNVAEEVLREIPGFVPSIGSAVNNGNGGASFVDLRGLGTGIGPILTRALFLDTRRWPLVCALSIAVSGLGYLVVGALGATFGVLVPIIVAHAASGSNWVLSTVILQADVPDAIRGRILSAELMVLTAVEAAVILGAAALLESGALSLEVAFFAFAGLQILSGLAYTRWVMAPEATSPGAAGR